MKPKFYLTLVSSIIILVLLISGCKEVKTYESEYNQSQLEIEQLNDQLEEEAKQIIELKQELKDVEQFNKFYTKALVEYNNGIFDRSDANYDYDLWSFYYNEGYYFDSIQYCVAARELFSSSNSYYQKTISYFDEAKKTADDKYDELIDFYIKASDIVIDINWAMYEACEYYESASDLYDKGLFEAGDEEIETGNEKILIHDSLIKEYNSYIFKIEVLEENV